MKLAIRATATAAMLAAGAIGFASPASADELNGSYRLFSDQSQRRANGNLNPYPSSTAIWNIAPCGPGCARISSATGWTADAFLRNGRWEFGRDATWSCPDGRQLPNRISYSIDAATLTGTSTGDIPTGCEGFRVFVDGITVTLTEV